jgi:hypothetical protein
MGSEPNRQKIPKLNIGDLVVIYATESMREYYGLVVEIQTNNITVKEINNKWGTDFIYLSYDHYFFENRNAKESYCWKKVEG